MSTNHPNAMAESTYHPPETDPTAVNTDFSYYESAVQSGLGLAPQRQGVD